MRGKTGADLIFKGSKEVHQKSRAGVTITFDNRDRVFSLSQSNEQTNIGVDFDEVAIGREVFSDGSSTYTINGTEVRMKDIHELIASVNIGSSGHHIISQGEADRYLNANSKDRRILIEEALGLKMYQYRIKESERKLERAQDNLREAELMRRELAPHLKFLKRQVEKLEKAKEIRVELEKSYREYFQKEDFLIEQIQKGLEEAETELSDSLHEAQELVDSYGEISHYVSPYRAELENIEKLLEESRSHKQAITREISKGEGMISVLQNPEEPKVVVQQHYSRNSVVNLIEKIINRIHEIRHDDANEVTEFFTYLKDSLSSFIQSETTVSPVTDNSERLAQLELEKIKHEEEYQTQEAKERELLRQREELREQEQKNLREKQESERNYYQHQAALKELNTRKELLTDRKSSLIRRVEDRDEEYQEARVLLGNTEFITQGQMFESFTGITAESQNFTRREIERLKIRLEDIGGGSGIEIIHEYEETAQRDAFLEKEITDVNSTIQSLTGIITDLKNQLNIEFGTGIQKINTEFNRFFGLMFGGGHALLREVRITRRKSKAGTEADQMEIFDEEENLGYGIDIEVSLPRKKVTDLDMLSGGERSLTSIALLFALSQVNPPPFLVLDETDAALDEANSQKYGDMIEALSSYSQLILVTHNRETMSRAQTLFGVTLGRDDASTTLSLRLEDAEKYAK